MPQGAELQADGSVRFRIWAEGSQGDNETLGPWSVRWSRTKIGDKED
jgi:hypothetical protein